MNPILKQSWNFLGNHFWLLALFTLPFLAVDFFVEYLGFEETKNQLASSVALVNSFLLWPLLQGILILLIAKLADSDRLTLSEAVKQVIPFWVGLFVVNTITQVVVGLGLLFFILPGIWLYLKLFLAPYYVVLEGKPAIESLQQAYENSEEHFATFLKTLLPPLVLTLVILFIASGTGNGNYPLLISELLISKLLSIYITIVEYRLYQLYIQ